MARCLSLIVLFFMAHMVSAQSCVPDQNVTTPGFFPRVIEPAYVDTDYKQVLQIRVFEDTTVVIGGNPVVALIDSINVLDIKGLPNGFYYTCSRKNCSFIPDSTGCSTLEGRAGISDVGTHPLDIELEVFAKIFGTISTSEKDTIRDFTVEVVDDVSVGDLTKSNGLLYPNPSYDGKVLISKIIENTIVSVECFNQLGQSVDYELVNGRIVFTSGESGLYTVLVHMKNGKTLNQKLLIQK